MRDPAPITLPSHKTCRTCGIHKEISCYQINKKGSRRGLPGKDCKECLNSMRKKSPKVLRYEPTRREIKQNLNAYLAWRKDMENED